MRVFQPEQTDPSIKSAKGPHLTVFDDRFEPNGLLLVSLAGTNCDSAYMLAFDGVAAREGYTALALDYPNTVLTTDCDTSPEDDPHTRFRQEIVTGQSVSDLVEVDQSNSIENRLEAALRHQVQADLERFSPFLDEDGPVWERIVLAGHSQGAGHAAYLAKTHPVQAALMLAGPQDSDEASWLHQPSATTPDRFYSFLHCQDDFGSQHQLQLSRILRHQPDLEPDQVQREPSSAPVVVTCDRVRKPHMAVLLPRFAEVWRGLLGQAD